MLARGEVPADVRTGEFAQDKIDAFCGQLNEMAAAIIARAEEATQVCAQRVAEAGEGWWTSVCTA